MSDELYSFLPEIARLLPDDPSAWAPVSANQRMHEALVLCCHEGTQHQAQAFGNLFSQVDYLCRKHRVATRDKIAIQTMRRHSNQRVALSVADLRYDLRALARFISAITATDIPDSVVRIIPAENRPYERAADINYRYVRCIVTAWDEHTITATAEQSTDTETIVIDYSAEHLRYIHELLSDGMQLNLLDCTVEQGRIRPALIIVEPDFLIDISSIAACFEPHGHHPLGYTLRRLAPVASTQPILLGNLASQILDDTVNHSADLNGSIRKNFRRKALEFCTCTGFSSEQFVRDAGVQSRNICQAVASLLSEKSPDGSRLLEKAILEPSFVCERLGLQGRVDLMTTDFRLLVEQKSGKNYYVERRIPGEHGSMMLENNYVQLLLYYGVLRQNFNLSFDRVDMRLLYSRYPAEQGLVVVNYLQRLFREAIEQRNLIVAWELYIARHGFGSVIDLLKPDTFNTRGQNSSFFERWKRPELQAICDPLHRLSDLERTYFCRMMTFVYREQRVSRLGVQEGTTAAANDYWTMPLSQKLEAGNIIVNLTITKKEMSDENGGYDLITLSPLPAQHAEPTADEAGLLSTNEAEQRGEVNFRPGDAVYLYAYKQGQEPDLRNAILYKGTLETLQEDKLVVALNDGQQNGNVLGDGPFAIEHAASDTSTTSIRSLYAFITGPKACRDLLLAQRQPRHDDRQRLSRSYHRDYDSVLLKARQARDYFLLVGPPGTGKTSMALRFLVEEELAAGQDGVTDDVSQPAGHTDHQHTADGNGSSAILLMSYTNRAVDEICDMLVTAGHDFIRIGSPHRCDPRFRKFLLANRLGEHPRLDSMQTLVRQARLVVATTTTVLSHTDLFRLKDFALAIVDEASQILEPDLVGLLARVPRFILIGDHKQLPAVVQQGEADSRVEEPLLRDIKLSDCRDSLFERLLRIERTARRTQFIGTLNHQGRMHPDIASFPNTFFYVHENIQPVPLPHQLEDSAAPRLLFIPATLQRKAIGAAASSVPTNTSRSNPVEAAIVAQELQRVYREYGDSFDPNKTVGVIVPYRNQIAQIRRETAALGIPALQDISIDTVERYQGSQRDVIIFSFTVSRRYELDFLTASTFIDTDGTIVDRKLNVALTRARKQLILTGDPALLSRIPIFAHLLEHVREHGTWLSERT